MGIQDNVNSMLNTTAAVATAVKATKNKEKQSEEKQYQSDLETIAKISEEINTANRGVTKTETKIAPLEKELSNYSTDEEGNVLTKSGKKAGKRSLDKKTRLEHDLGIYQEAMSNLQQVIAAKTKIREMATQRVGIYEGGKK